METALGGVLAELAPREAMNDEGQKRRVPELAGCAERLRCPTPQVEAIVVLCDEAVAEAKLGVDVIYDLPPGVRERIARDPVRDPRLLIGVVRDQLHLETGTT